MFVPLYANKAFSMEKYNITSEGAVYQDDELSAEDRELV